MDDNYRATPSFAVVARRSVNRAIEPEVMEVRNAVLMPFLVIRLCDALLPLNHSPSDDMEDVPVLVLA